MKENITAILKYLLLYTGIFSTTLPLVFYLLYKRSSKEKSLRVILFYILYCIFNEALSFYLQSIHSETFLILLYSFTILEFSFFSLFIFVIIPESFVKRIIRYLWLCFIIFYFIDLVFINKGKGFDSVAMGIECILVLFLCSSYLFLILRKSNNLFIYSTFEFWIVITFLIYFSGTFFLYILAESMRDNLAFRGQYFIINISFNLLKNVLLSIALTMKLSDTVNQQKNTIPDLDDDLFISENVNFPN